MSEWSSYGLSDFLMFSPEAYWRLVARHNAAWWPAHLVGAAACLALVPLILRGATRAALLVLGLAWAWVAWSFHAQRYSEIFLAAGWLAAASGLQAFLLPALAPLARPDATVPRTRRFGLALILIALAYPLLAPLTGRSWTQAEVFGILPDPTTLATLGALLALAGLRAWMRVVLAWIPVLALLFATATRSLVG